MLANEALNRANAQSGAAVSQIKSELLSSTLDKDPSGKIRGIVDLSDDTLRTLNGKFGSQALKFIDDANRTTSFKQAERNNNIALNNAMANNLRYNNDLLNTASGVRGESGKVSALASAMAAASKENKEEVESLANLTKSLNFSGNDYNQI